MPLSIKSNTIQIDAEKSGDTQALIRVRQDNGSDETVTIDDVRAAGATISGRVKFGFLSTSVSISFGPPIGSNHIGSVARITVAGTFFQDGTTTYPISEDDCKAAAAFINEFKPEKRE